MENKKKFHWELEQISLILAGILMLWTKSKFLENLNPPEAKMAYVEMSAYLEFECRQGHLLYSQ